MIEPRLTRRATAFVAALHVLAACASEPQESPTSGSAAPEKPAAAEGGREPRGSAPEYHGYEEYEESVEMAGPDPVEPPPFPWPPPKPSAFVDLTPTLRQASALGHVATTLEHNLRAAGHAEWSYFGVPGGFALATRLEQIDAEATSLGGADRWAEEVPRLQEFSLGNILRAIFSARPGYWRIVVFVVSSTPYTPSAQSVQPDAASAWVFDGLNKLPPHIAELAYGSEHRCRALIYEFERPTRDHEPTVRVPGRHNGETHLTGGRILPIQRSASDEDDGR